METLQIFKNNDDHNAVMHGNSVEYYETTLNGYDYVMHGAYPFRYINGLNEKREISPALINSVIRTNTTVIVILELNGLAHNIIWDSILND